MRLAKAATWRAIGVIVNDSRRSHIRASPMIERLDATPVRGRTKVTDQCRETTAQKY
jgi:hypothetical protein